MKNFLTFLFLIFSFYSYANIELPPIFSDGMVLQRDKPIPVWGWADANEKIEIHFNKQIVKTKADKNGKWQVNLKSETAGGPYNMSIKGKNLLTLKNILVGEVWVCSGQSNMEFTVIQSMNAQQEMKDANYPMIRQFLVENDVATTPKQKLKNGKWNVCNTNTVGDFSAVGYFFAKKIHSELKIPVGIIHTSWGGTCVETWTSRDAFEGSDEFKDMIANMPDIDTDSILEFQIKSVQEKVEKIQGSKISMDHEEAFKNPDYNNTNWPEMNAPGLWENQALGNLDGTVWMRKTFTISKDDANKEAILELAKIDDIDITYVNGKEVGTTNLYNLKRDYKIPAGLLKEGTNTIAIRIIDNTGGGGIYGEASDLKLTTQNAIIPLTGAWKYQVVDVLSSISPNSYPSLLFNAMLNPLIPYAIEGVLWYQGEANVNRAQQYKTAFPLMIADWRQKWNQGDFPFYFVQLSSFDEFGGNSNKGSKWAELREAQTYTLKTIPNTGMAVTTDVGNAMDIHPTNKQDVGNRLAVIALKNVYNKDVVFSGPTYKSMEIKDNQIILSFDNIGSGLMTPDKYGYLKGFDIAGADKTFHFAKAYINDNKVIVYHDDLKNPIAVRFGWADDAGDCNLYNEEKFPASPFRTDDWKGITENEKYQF